MLTSSDNLLIFRCHLIGIHINRWGIAHGIKGFLIFSLTLSSKRVVFPAIELSYLQHQLAHQFGNEWLVQNYGSKASEMGAKWKQLQDADMDALARHMLVNANAEIALKYPHAAPIQNLDFKLALLRNNCLAALKTFRLAAPCPP